MEELDYDYAIDKRDDQHKTQLFIYTVASSMREYATDLFQYACRLTEKEVISSEEHGRCLFWYRKIYQRECNLLYILHENGFLEPNHDLPDEYITPYEMEQSCSG